MKPYQIPQRSCSLRLRIDDEERLESLRSYKILDTGPEPGYEKVVEVLHAVCNSAWTAVTFVDRERQWFKALRGFDQRETPRSMSFCSVSMQQIAPLIIENALLDARFKDNYLVKERGIRFFAGYPFFSNDGYGLGSVCVLNMQPSTLLMSQLDLIEKARNWVQADLERRRSALEWQGGTQSSNSEERRLGDPRQKLKKIMADQAWETFLAAAPASSLAGGAR